MVAVLHPTGPGQQIPIDRAVVLIGRGPECDAVIDFSTKISRMHCALVQVDTGYYIRDLGSMNGVWVDGQRVEKDAKLTNGVEVAIGDVKFQYLENVQPAAKLGRVVAGRPGMPVLVDECIEDVEIIDDDVVDLVEDVEILELMDEVEIVDDVVEVMDIVEIVEDVEVIEDVQIVPDEPRRSSQSRRLR